jgi:tRNA(adenine34) deaminase
MEKIFDDQYFMKEALKEAHTGMKKGEIPVGAVIVCNEKIVARSHNEVETLQDPTAHAEILAITAAANYLNNKYLTGCTLYVTVEPCPMCAAALYWARPQRIVFATPDPKKGYQRHQPSLLHPKTTVDQGLLKEEARTLMEQFFSGLRKNKQ